jgi:protein involved in polysaccharide export with SLBB domain
VTKSKAKLVNGWIEVPYVGSGPATVYIATGVQMPGRWRPAFVDAPRKVAKVRPPAERPGTIHKVWVRAGGTTTLVGQIQF